MVVGEPTFAYYFIYHLLSCDNSIQGIISGNIAHDNTKNDGFKGDANRSNKNFRIEEIFKEFGEIAKLEGGDIRSVGLRSQKLYTTTRQTGMTRSKKTALKDGASSAHDFQLSDFMGVFP